MQDRDGEVATVGTPNWDWSASWRLRPHVLERLRHAVDALAWRAKPGDVTCGQLWAAHKSNYTRSQLSDTHARRSSILDALAASPSGVRRPRGTFSSRTRLLFADTIPAVTPPTDLVRIAGLGSINGPYKVGTAVPSDSELADTTDGSPRLRADAEAWMDQWMRQEWQDPDIDSGLYNEDEHASGIGWRLEDSEWEEYEDR